MDLTEDEIKSIRELHDLVANKYYYEMFSVSNSASEDDIKTAYYSMSREWHPDRFFRRDVGKYSAMLEEIFIGINKAYQILSTPEDRALFNRTYTPKETPKKRMATTNTAWPSYRKGSRRRNRDKSEKSTSKPRLTRKEKIIAKMREEMSSQKKKSQSFFALGKKQLEDNKPMQAAASLHVAYKLEPKNKEYSELYRKARRLARSEKAMAVFAQAESAENYQNYQEAIRQYKKAIEFEVEDARAYARLAYLIERLEPDPRESLRLMQIAVRKAPENPEYRCILGEIYAREGMELNAKREFQAALKLQRNYARAKEGLKNL